MSKNESNVRSESSDTLISVSDLSEQVKANLRGQIKLAKSNSKELKKTLRRMNIIALCPMVELVSEYAHALEDILVSNNVFDIRGKDTYLELDFPIESDKKTITRFFNAANKVSANPNAFYGVFVISLRKFSSYKELVSHEYYEKLCEYIEINNDNIVFVFHVDSDKFDGLDRLMDDIEKRVNVRRITLERPGIEKVINYALHELEERGFTVKKEDEKSYSELFANKVNIDAESFQGYSTIRRFNDALAYEAYQMCGVNVDGTLCMNKDVLNRLDDIIEFNLNDEKPKIRMGF